MFEEPGNNVMKVSKPKLIKFEQGNIVQILLDYSP
jgi:hypothetical protein